RGKDEHVFDRRSYPTAQRYNGHEKTRRAICAISAAILAMCTGTLFISRYSSAIRLLAENLPIPSRIYVRTLCICGGLDFRELHDIICDCQNVGRGVLEG